MQNEAININDQKQAATREADKLISSGPSTRKAPEEAKVRY